MQPLLSVLMTSYNREQFIAEAIESVLASTYSNFELIVVDDCSKDNTATIAKSYAEKDSRIRVYINERNLGDYPNRNRAASYARGEYIVITDSDDWMFKDSLIKWVSYVQKYHANFGIFSPGLFPQPVLLSSKATIQQHFFQKPLLMYGPSATIIKTSYFKKINGFPVKYGPANDMYYNLKAASQTDILVIPIPLGDYRRHEGQEINNSYSYLYNNYRYLSDALQELDLPLTKAQRNYLEQKNKRRFAVNWFKYLIQSKDLNKAITAISNAEFKWKDWVAGIFAFQKLPLNK